MSSLIEFPITTRNKTFGHKFALEKNVLLKFQQEMGENEM